MGMNYFCDSMPCSSCGVSRSSKHIGKSSVGWKFLFHGSIEGPSTYKEWIEELSHPNKIIINEENEIISLQEFIDEIHDHGRQEKMKSSANIYTGIKFNQNEIEYMTERQNKYLAHEEDLHKYYWVDQEGYGFCNNEFR